MKGLVGVPGESFGCNNEELVRGRKREADPQKDIYSSKTTFTQLLIDDK